MATYNGEKFINEQLDSILSQTRPPDELVICDDCSTDSTLEFLYSFRERCQFPVKIFSNSKTLWVTKNFENGIMHSTGDIIVLADQDDIWYPYKIEKTLQAFMDNPDCGYIFSDAQLICENGTPLKVSLWQSVGFNKKRIDKYNSGKQLDVMLRDGNFVYGMSMAFRAIYIPYLFPIDSHSFNCTHDTWIAIMLSAKGKYGVAIREHLVKYRQHDKQLAGSGLTKPSVFTKLINIFKTNNSIDDLDLADALENIASRLQNQKNSKIYTQISKKQLIDKAIHLRARYLAGNSKVFERLKIVYSETISGRYGFFSRSLISIIKDLLAFH